MTVIVNQNDTVLVIAQSKNALIVGAGIQGLTGAAANVTGITGFTNGSGFTGNVTNNNLSLVLQNANASQAGQLTASDWTLFNSTLGNVTLAQGNITDLQGNMTAAQGNITAAQGNITGAQNGITNLSNHTTTINSTLNTHIGNYTNPHNVTATQLNLGNVDNTADLDKPISNLTQTALNAKLDANQKGATNGVAELVGGTVPSAQLPSYVDDVIEAANFASLPVTGEAGKIYVTLDTNLTYRWSGSAYAEISASLALGELSSTAYRGDRGAIAYNHSQETGNPHNATTANISDSTNKRYVTDSQLVNITNLSGTNTGDQNLSGYVQDTRTINGQNLTTNITINHSTNSGLGWTSAGHTGANLTVAGFNATGAATELSISGNGTGILSNNSAALGTPSSGDLSNCNGTAAGLTAGNVTNINVSNVTGTLAVANGGTGESTVSGWIALGACTYETADSPTFQFSIAADVTGFIGVGNRIKLTQTTVKYFLVTAVGAYSGGKTIITVYGGTDYTLDNAAITLPYFSIQKAPFGFPLDPAKWTVRLSDANTRTQSSPTQNTIYNLGSLSLVMPIGVWDITVQLCPFFASTGLQVAGNMEFGLSTSTSSFSDSELKGYSYQGSEASTQIQINNFYRSKIISVASKVTHYLVARTLLTTTANINFLGANSPSIVEFRSAYL